MKIDNKDYKTFLIPGIIILLILIITVFVLKPRFSLTVENRNRLLADKKLLAGLTSKLATLEGLAEVEFSDKVDVVLNVLPSEKDVPRNLSVVKKIALNNSLLVSDISISDIGEIATTSSKQKVVKGSVLPFFTLDIKTIGSRELIKNFIKQLESTAPLMKITSVSISQKKADVTETSLEIQAFFLPFPKTIGKPEQQLVPITSEEDKTFEKINGFAFFTDEESLPNLPVGKENLFSP